MQRYFLKTCRHFIAPNNWVGGNIYFGVRLFCAAAVLSFSSCGMMQNKVEASSSGGSANALVEKLYPIEAKPLDVVNVKGSGFYYSKNLKARLALDGGMTKDVPLTIVDRNNATFVMPDGAGLGLKSVSIVQGESTELASFRLVANTADNQLPILIDDQSEICSTKVYIDRNGDQKTGTKDCASGTVPECSSNGQQSCVATGAYFAGAACASDGSNCFLPTYSVMSQPLKAISYNSIDQTKMLDTLTLSGVTGAIASQGSWDLSLTFPGAGFYTGITNSPGAGSFASGMTIAGVSGTGAIRPADCSADGGTGCVAVAAYPAAQASGAASKILSGQTLAGVSGNVTLPAVGKVYTGITYGVSGTGNTGTLTLPSAANVLSGSGTYGDPGAAVTPTLANRGTWSLTSSFPGAGYYAGVSNSPTAASIASGTTITGVAGSGTIESHSNCSADGATGCVAVATYPAALVTGAASKVLSGQTLAGVAGNVTLPAVGKVYTGTNYGVSGTGNTGTLTLPSAANVLSGSGAYGDPGAAVSPALANQGTWNLTSSFPGAGYYAAVSNAPTGATIASGTTITGVAGTGTIESHSNCSADGATGCVTTASYKSADMTAAIAGNIKSGSTVAGVAGSVTSESHSNCSADGATGCVAVATYPAALATGAASKILSGQTLAGVAGNVTLPAVGKVYTGITYGVSGTGSTGTLTIPAAGNVLSTAPAYGDPGAQLTPSLTNQGSWAVASAFPGAGYYSGVSSTPAASTYTGILFGTAGTATVESHSNCSANGQQSCVATGTFFAGTACALDGSNCFLPAYSVPGLQTKKAIDYATLDTSKMLDSLTVSGITGALASKGSWNLTLAFPGAGYYTGTSNAPTGATIASGTTITGVAGTGTIESHSNCAADGVTGCVTTASYKSADMTSAITGNIKSGSTIAGVAGSVTSESHSNCAADGATGCVAVATYPAALATGAASKILSGQTLAGVSGNVTLPAAGKVYTGTNYGVSGTGNTGTLTLPSAANVLSGSGTYGDPGAVVTPTLANQGTWNLTTSFPGAGYYAAVSNSPTAATISSGTTITGVAGSGTLESHSNCSANGQQSCVASGTYFAGTACGTDGSACYLPTYASGTQNKKAIDFSTIDSSKMLSTLTVSGVIGSIAAQAWNLQNSFPGSGYYSSVTNTPATSNYTGTLFGSAGTATIESHSNCSADGATGCVTTSSYKSANMTNAVATNIKSGVTIAGILGSYTGGGGGTVCGLGGNASGNCTLSQYNASTYPLYATFSGGGDPAVYGTTLNLNQNYYSATMFTYTFKANETKWFKWNWTNAPGISDDYNFASTQPFTATIYNNSLSVDANYSVCNSCSGLGGYIDSSNSTGSAFIKVVNGSTAQTITISISGTNY